MNVNFSPLNIVCSLSIVQLQLAQIQSLANAGARTPINPHQSFTDKMVEDALFPPGASPPHINNLHTPNGKFPFLEFFVFHNLM